MNLDKKLSAIFFLALFSCISWGMEDHKEGELFLPNDLMMQILSWGDHHDLSKISMVCRECKRLTNIDELWQNLAGRLRGKSEFQGNSLPWKQIVQAFVLVLDTANMEKWGEAKIQFAVSDLGFEQIRNLLLKNLEDLVLERMIELVKRDVDFAAASPAFYILVNKSVRADENEVYNQWDDAWDDIFEQRSDPSWREARDAAEEAVKEVTLEVEEASDALEIQGVNVSHQHGMISSRLRTLYRLSRISQEKYLDDCFNEAFLAVKNKLIEENFSASREDTLLVCEELGQQYGNNPYAQVFTRIFTALANI